MENVTLAVAKSYAEELLMGQGVIKGEDGKDGADGADGFSPIIVENASNTDEVYKLDITTKDGTFTTTNLVGKQGIQGIQGVQGEQGETGLQGQQGIQGIKGDKGDDGYPFLIYKQYEVGIEEFNEADYPEIGLMFMVHVWEDDKGYPVYRYTADGTDTPYSLVTHMNTEGIKGEKGDKGEDGAQGVAGLDGKDGKDGTTYTPSIGEVTTVESNVDASAGVTVDEETKEAVFDFAIPKGENGADGFSPIVTITETDNGHNVAIEDKNGVQNFEVLDGTRAYTSLLQLGLTADGTVNDIITKLSAGESALINVAEFNDKTQFPDTSSSNNMATVSVRKTNEIGRTVVEWFKKDGRYAVAVLDGTNKVSDWREYGVETKKGLAQNSQYYKIDITKKGNKYKNGVVRFSYNNGTMPCEVAIYLSYADNTGYVGCYTYTYGTNCIQSITLTGDDTNVVIGIELTKTVYGTQLVEVNDSFCTINNLTAEQFTGDVVATLLNDGSTPITELTDLGLDGSATIQNVMDKMLIGQHCILNTSRFNDKTQVGNIEYGKVEIRRLSSGMWSLWLEDVLHGDTVAHGTCSNGKFTGWHYFTTKSYVDNLIADLQAQINALK